MASIGKRMGLVLVFIFLLLWIQLFVPARGLCDEKTFTNSLGMDFVLIPAGTFLMGSPPSEFHRHRSEEQYRVTIRKPFYMQTTEVTLEQWRALMGKRFFGLFKRKGVGNSPIVKVSWFDSVKFIEKLNALNEGTYRLPIEAEWEYAARAGSQAAYSWGKDIDCKKAMFANNTQDQDECVQYIKSKGLAVNGPAPVKSYPPNAWGLYDMHGNVWEWCENWFVDDSGKKKGKVRRGGSWFGLGNSCRSANRAWANPASRFHTTGFRLVREAP